MATWHYGEPFGGLRDPHLHSGKRSSHGSPPGSDPSGDFDFGAECSIGRSCRPFDCDQVPCCSGVRQRRGSADWSRDQLFACGLCRRGSPTDEGVRSSCSEILHFWPELPETLPSSVSLQEQALEWISQESDSRVHYYSAAEDAEAAPKFVQPAAKKIVLKPEAPSKAKKVTTAALAEQLAALSEALPTITSQLELLQTNQAKLETALNRPQVGSQAPHKLDFPLPSGGAAVDVKSFAQAVGPPPRTNFSTPLRHQARETLPEDEPTLLRGWIHASYAFSQPGRCPYRYCPGLHPAEPGHDSPCCPFDRQPRPYERSGIVEFFKFRPLIKRGGKEGETTMRARKSIRQLHAVRGSECFQTDETDRPPTSSSSGFPRQIFVHSLLREAGRLPEPSRSCLDPMDASPHSRQSSCRRFERSSGNDSSVYGLGRPGLPRQRKMGGSLLVEFAGRPPTGAVCSKGKTDKSSGGCFLADLPSSLGDYNVDFHQRDGHHQQSSLRGCWEESGIKARGRGRPAQSKTEAKVSKEAKARRMIYDGAHIGSQTCMLRRGALCSEIRSCQGPPVPSTPLDAKTSHGDGGGQQSYWNSLQTFSFVRWCSGLLGDVLATSTPFASFLRSTLYASRSTVQAPEKALFPLPFPKLGIFAPLPSRCSSRMRRKFGFDRAFHVMIAALNFLYADCTFPPLEMLVRKPSTAQRRALWNLRSLFKAFGSSSEDFSVPNTPSFHEPPGKSL